MKSIATTMCVAALLGVAPGAAMGQGGEVDAVQQAKSALLEVLAGYEPGSQISEALKGRVGDAAAALQQAAGGPPDLLANIEQLSGQWVNLFSSQGVVGEIDVSFMPRALPGGGHAGGKALSKVVLQELRPAENFYRNMMVMTAGEQDTPLLHVATAMVDIVTILLGFSVGASTQAQTFLTPQSMLIFGLGALSFAVATASGVLFAKLMNALSKEKINPLVGAAGVSAVPDSARVVQMVGQREDAHNFLLMHAMAPNVAGVIGSAVAAGILWSVLVQ